MKLQLLKKIISHISQGDKTLSLLSVKNNLLISRYLLGKEGFEHLDPFVPIHVDKYTPKEFISCMDYYRERKWIRYFPQQNEEMALLSVYNPYKLMQLCEPM